MLEIKTQVSDVFPMSFANHEGWKILLRLHDSISISSYRTSSHHQTERLQHYK